MPFVFEETPTTGKWRFVLEDAPTTKQPSAMEGLRKMVAPIAESPAYHTLEDIGQVYPALEAGASLATGMVALPFAGIAGLGQLAAQKTAEAVEARTGQRMPEWMKTSPTERIEDVAGAMTYKPMTERGQRLAGTVMYPFDLLMQAGEKGGDITLEKYPNHPGLAAFVATAIEGAPVIILLAKGIKGKAADVLKKKAYNNLVDDTAAWLAKNEKIKPDAARSMAADIVTNEIKQRGGWENVTRKQAVETSKALETMPPRMVSEPTVGAEVRPSRFMLEGPSSEATVAQMPTIVPPVFPTTPEKLAPQQVEAAKIPIGPKDNINAITREEFGKMVAEGNPAAARHVAEGILEKPNADVVDAAKNEIMAQVAKAPKGPERDAVRANIAKVEPLVNEAIAHPEQLVEAELAKVKGIAGPGEKSQRTYDKVQADIDAYEEGLGVFVGGKYRPVIESSVYDKAKTEGWLNTDWIRMPEALEHLYEERDAIGQTERTGVIGFFVDSWGKKFGMDEAATKAILKDTVRLTDDAGGINDAFLAKDVETFTSNITSGSYDKLYRSVLREMKNKGTLSDQAYDDALHVQFLTGGSADAPTMGWRPLAPSASPSGDAIAMSNAIFKDISESLGKRTENLDAYLPQLGKKEYPKVKGIAEPAPAAKQAFEMTVDEYASKTGDSIVGNPVAESTAKIAAKKKGPDFYAEKISELERNTAGGIRKPEQWAVKRRVSQEEHAKNHREWVEAAIKTKHTVPAEVLKDYPDLAPKAEVAKVSPLSPGSTVKVGKSPQTHTIVEELPTTEAERSLGQKAAALAKEQQAGRVTLPGGKGNKHMTLSDPAVEKAMDAAKGGIGTQSSFGKLREYGAGFLRGFTRRFKPLPDNAEFSEANKSLIRMNTQKEPAAVAAQKILAGVFGNYSQADADIITKAIVLNDAAESLAIARDRGEPFHYAFGITDANVGKLKAEVDAHLANFPDIAGDLANYYTAIEDVVARKDAAMQALGIKGYKEGMSRKAYFHHQVLAQAENDALVGAGKPKIKPFRGFEQRRKGKSEAPFNLNVPQAMFKVIAQQEYDILLAENMLNIKNHYDGMPVMKKYMGRIKQRVFGGLVWRGDFIDPVISEKVNRLSEIGKEKGELFEAEDFRETDIIRLDNERRQVTQEIQAAIDQYRDKLKDPAFREQEEIRLKEWYEEKQREKLEKSEELGDEEIDALLEELEAPDLNMVARRFTDFQLALLNGDVKPWAFAKKVMPNHRATVVRDIFYRTKATGADVIDEILAGTPVTVDGMMLKDVLIKADPEVWLLPKEIVETFDHIAKQRGAEHGALYGISRGTTSLLKRWFLFAPHNVSRYIINNTIGDTSFLVGVAPKAVIGQYLGTSLKVLNARRRFGQPTGLTEQQATDIDHFFKAGGEDVGFTRVEIDRVQKHPFFSKGFDQPGMLDRILGIPRAYLDKVYDFNTLTETHRRLAAYLYFLDQWRSGKQEYGGANREVVDGMVDVRDKAYQIANDTLVNYPEISESGREMARHMIFYSFREGNIRRFYNVFRNIHLDEKAAASVLKKAGVYGTIAAGKATAGGAMKAAKFTILVGLLQAISAAWNNLEFPDEEKQLSDETRAKPHFIIGKDKSGNIEYFQTYDALTELLSWFGMDNPMRHADNIAAGRWKDVAVDIALGPVNSMYGLINPLVKSPLEVALGKTGWPKIQDPKTIRDRYEYVARMFGLTPEYRALTGIPDKPYLEQRAKGLLLKEVAEGEAAYYKALDLANRFKRSRGLAVVEVLPGKSGIAFRNMLRAQRLGQYDKAQKFAAEFAQASDEKKMAPEDFKQSVKTSLMNMNPAHGLGKYADEFNAYLSPREKAIFNKGIEHYGKMFQPIGGQ